MRGRLAIALAATAALATPTLARADDQSLFDAYTGHENALQDTQDRYLLWYERWTAGHHTRRVGRGLIKADKRMDDTLDTIADDVSVQLPSTASGREAKDYAIREIDAWETANRYEVHGIRLLLAGKAKRAHLWLHRASRTMNRRTYPYGHRVVAAFEAVGLTPPNGALSSDED